MYARLNRFFHVRDYYVRGLLIAALVATIVLRSPIPATADLLDAEKYNNHLEQIQQMNNTTMIRQLNADQARGAIQADARSGSISGLTSDQRDQLERRRRNLEVPPKSTGRIWANLMQHIRTRNAAEKAAVLRFLTLKLAAFPADIAHYNSDINDVASVRAFALERAYRVVRPNEPPPYYAFAALQQQLVEPMEAAYIAHRITTEQKEDDRDYYILAEIAFSAILDDRSARHDLLKPATAFIKRDLHVDPAKVAFTDLACIGVWPGLCSSFLIPYHEEARRLNFE